MENNYLTKVVKDDDYIENAIKKFVCHISLNPYDVEAWISLGKAYSQKAYDLLSFGFVELEEKIQVSTLQTVYQTE